MKRARTLGFTAAAALALLVVGWVSQLTTGSPAPVADPDPTSDERASTATTPPLQEDAREELPIPAAEQEQRSPRLGFAEYLEQLVCLATAAAEARRKGDKARVATIDTQGRELLEEMLRELESPEESALHALTGFLPEDATLAGQIRWSICLQLVRMGLELRHKHLRQGDLRDPLDHLLLSILACIPQEERLAKDLEALLLRQPYLDVPQENAVLDLVAVAPEQPFLIPIATELLLTLWTNLEANGTRSSSELASLALLFKGDTNPSRRLAALRHLLCADGGRYKELVLRDAIDRRDPQVLGELALTISKRLPPKQAIADLLRISQVSSQSLTPALLNLGWRDAGVLREAYDKQLGNAAHADFRAHLVTGAGFQQGPAGLKLALDAMEVDPDANVRCRALMVVTTRADPALAEKRVMALLDGPEFSNSPEHLGKIVLALQNLATRNCRNTIRRVADRILAMGKLRAGDERLLRRLRDDH